MMRTEGGGCCWLRVLEARQPQRCCLCFSRDLAIRDFKAAGGGGTVAARLLMLFRRECRLLLMLTVLGIWILAIWAIGFWFLYLNFLFFNIPGPDSGFLGLRPEPGLKMSGFENFAPYHFSYKTPFRINLHLKTK